MKRRRATELRQSQRSLANQSMERKDLLGRRRINPTAKLNGLPPPDTTTPPGLAACASPCSLAADGLTLAVRSSSGLLYSTNLSRIDYILSSGRTSNRAPDLHFGGSQLVSCTGRWVSWLRFLAVFYNTSS
jgi:hypothetical protein